MNVSKVYNLTTPLCFLSDGRLLSYHQGKVVLMRDGRPVKSFPVPVSRKEFLLGWSRTATRLFRFGVRAAEALVDGWIVLSLGNNIYELNVETGELSKGWSCGEGIRPLIFTTVKGIDGFDEGIYFGGYRGNNYKEPVHIYHRSDVDKWEVVYTFPQGAINHVHNVVADPYRQCLWIFTGDFGESSAIWKVTEGFRSVERIVCNDQKYRGCVVFSLPEGLLYSTDAPFADDFIYLMNPGTYEVKKLSAIDGSCIYGCQWKDRFVFSSTVEGDGRHNSRWQFYFGRKRGAGIKDDYVHLYMGNLQEGFREIYREKKDCMPFYTFQFGVFRFPYGVNNTDTLWFQPVATRKNDLDLMALTR